MTTAIVTELKTVSTNSHTSLHTYMYVDNDS